MAARGGSWWRDQRVWVAGILALAAVVAVPALVLALGSSGKPSSSSGHTATGGGGTGQGGGGTSTTASTTTTSTTTTTTLNIATVTPPSSTTTTGPPTVTGKVTRAGGAPVPHAYVVGLDNLAVVTTNSKGDYTMPCSGQPLVISQWLMPVTSGGATVAGASGSAPPALGQGYVFSGGATDVSKAAPAPCNGAKPYDVRLPLGATVLVSLTTSTGAKFAPAAGQAPVDTFSLPGLAGRAAAVTAKVGAAGVQLVPQLGAGVLTINVTQGAFTCQGAGVVPTTPSSTVQVPTTPGRTVVVKCKMSATPAP